MAPSLLTRDEAHSVAGLFLFCLPLGAFLYLVFERLLKLPLLAFLPGEAGAPLPARLPSPAPWFAAGFSILVGAASHLLWDAFTHDDGFVVESLSILRVRLALIDGYELYVYTVLQHLSTVIGTALVLWWVRRSWRAVAATAIVVIATFATLWLATYTQGLGISAAREVARNTFSVGLRAVAVSLIVYSLLWHAMKAAKR